MGEMAYSGQLVILTAIDSIRPIRPTVTKRAVAATAVAIVWAYLRPVRLPQRDDHGLRRLDPVAVRPDPVDDHQPLRLLLRAQGHYAVTELENRHGIYGVWGWRGITAYLIGFAASIPFWSLSFYVSPVAKAANGLDISFIVELIVARHCLRGVRPFASISPGTTTRRGQQRRASSSSGSASRSSADAGRERAIEASV